MHYAISDVHGRMDAFLAMLDMIGFCPGDVLHIVGDMVDRGPDGVDIVRYCMAHGNIRPILGNHEDMVLKAMSGHESATSRARWRVIWLDNGGDTTERAFMALSDPDRAAVLDYLSGLPDHEDVDAGGNRFVLAHASWPGTPQDVLWTAPRPFMPKRGTDRDIIVGHTPVPMFFPDPMQYIRGCKSGHICIERFQGFTAIDCGCGLPAVYKKRALGCLRLDDMAEFYVPLA